MESTVELETSIKIDGDMYINIKMSFNFHHLGGERMDKKTAKMLTALIIPTVGVVGVTAPTETNAEMFSNLLAKQNQTETQLLNSQDVVDVTDTELKSILKGTLGIADNQEITIADMHRLTELEIGYGYDVEVHSLKGLEHAVNLERLSIKPQEIKDMSVIANLTNLVELDLSGNELSSIDFLSSLTNLETLHLAGTRISDISVIENLSKLKELNLEDNNISDISSLRNLASLERLSLSNNNIKSLPIFRNGMPLKYLNLGLNMELSEIDSIKTLTSLTELNLNRTNITSLEGLSSLTDLTQLSFNQTKVDDLSPLEGLSQLRYVSGNETRVHDFRPISHVNTTSFHGISLKSNAELMSEYLEIPVYGLNGDLIPVTSSSHGVWDTSKQMLQLTVVPLNGDVIEVSFGDGSTISGIIEVTAVINEIESPIIMVDQNTGKVVIKNIADNAKGYYRESPNGEWREYTGAFTATPVEYSGGKGHYYIEAMQKNYVASSEVVVNEFSMASKLSSVIYNFKWWTSGDAYITAKHAHQDAVIMYRLADRDWQRYTGQIDLSSYYKNGKVEMQFYAQVGNEQSNVTKFSILKNPTIEGVAGENKIKITHPLPKVNLYYRINGESWIPYTGEFELPNAGEYTIEAYAEEAGIESPISVPVLVKTSGQGTTNSGDGETNGNAQNGETGTQGNETSGGQSSTNSGQLSSSGSGDKLPDTGVSSISNVLVGGASVLGGAFMCFRKRK